jgi:hypothetical protein
MRLSTRLLSNAATTYVRLATTFVFGVFATWYMLGTLGVVGFGLIALATSSSSLSRSVEAALRSGLVRELAAAIATDDAARVRITFNATRRFCARVTRLVLVITSIVAGLAWVGFFNLPADQPRLRVALVALIVGEGLYVTARVLGAPFAQALFASQRVAIDNLLQVVQRATYALSAVLVFGVFVRGGDLQAQLVGFAASRVSLQLADVAIAVALARRLVPGLEPEASLDPREYEAVRSTVLGSSQVEVLLHFGPQVLAVLINLFFGLTYNSIWQVAVQFSGYARMASESLLRGIEPLTAQLLTRGRRSTAINLLAQAGRYQLAVTLAPAVFLAVYAEPLLNLWVRNRLAGDPNLAAAGVSPSQAVALASTMALLLLVARVLRASVYGIERGLYGMGYVHAYAWFAKWCALITVGLGTALLALTGRPETAPLALILAHGFFAVVVLYAARAAAGIPVAVTLSQSVPRPLAANVVFLIILLALRPHFEELSIVGLLALGSVALVAYGSLAILIVASATERMRIVELVTQGVH